MNTRPLVAGYGLSLMLIGVMWGQDISAVSIQTSYSHWAKVRTDKHKAFEGTRPISIRRVSAWVISE